MKFGSYIPTLTLILISGILNNVKSQLTGFKNVNLARTIDLTDPSKIKDLTSLVILNEGEKNADKYYFALSSKFNQSIASIIVQTKTEKTRLAITREAYIEKK